MAKKNKINYTIFIFIGLILLMVGIALIINFYPTPTTPTAEKGAFLNWVCKKPVSDAVKAATDKAVKDTNIRWLGSEACLKNINNPSLLTKCGGRVQDVVTAVNGEWNKDGGLKQQTIKDNNILWLGDNEACLNNIDNPSSLTTCGGRVGSVVATALSSIPLITSILPFFG